MNTSVSCKLGAALFVASLAPVHAQTTSATPVIIELEIAKAPKDKWAKNRFAASLQGKSLRLQDKGKGDFNDASFWEISFGKPLPYGRKIFSFQITIGDKHKPIWGTSLLQPILNGKEAEPAIGEDGKPTFKKIVADDGKGFIPSQSGKVEFAMATDARTLGSFAFMTAGARNGDFQLKDFQVKVWPQKDDTIRNQRPRMSRLTHLPTDNKTLLIEFHDDEGTNSRQEVEVTVEGPKGARTMAIAIPLHKSAASASRVGELDLTSLQTPGTYSVKIPSLGPQTKPATMSFEIAAKPDLTRFRNDAWGAFYWITDTETGPYPGTHQQDKAAKIFADDTKTQDVRGGWFDAGDYGKYSVNGAYALTPLLLTGLLAPQALDHKIEPIAGPQTQLPKNMPDWLQLATVQLEWLLKMQASNGGVYHKATTQKWPALDTPPAKDTAVKWLMPISSTATADFAGVMALAAKLFDHLDMPKRAADFRDAAERARLWLAANPDLTMIEQRYNGDEYGGPYTDKDDSDERFFADAAWAALTGDEATIKQVSAQLPQRRATLDKNKNDLYWGEVDLLGFWALKTAQAKLPEEMAKTVNATLRSAAHKWRITQKRSSWRIPLSDDAQFTWGSNSIMATVGWHWLLWAKLDGDTTYVPPAMDALHWLFGRNPLAQNFITGSGTNSAANPHFRPSVSGAIELPPGLIVGGPNSVDLAGDPTAGGLIGKPPMLMYVDDKESYATNEVAINWQVPYALMMSLLVDARSEN